MRSRLLLFCALIGFATGVFGKDVYLSIGGSVGVFRTDMRIFNPSFTKDIQVQAYLLAVGNFDNSGVQPKTITVPKRQMLVYDDVITSLFSASGLAGIRLKSDDDFVATQRIYAQSSSGCVGTLGQFVPGLDSPSAKKQGILIQLKSNGAAGQTGTYRTNIGAVNPNATTANVTWRLYDKNNALVGQPKVENMPPFAVIAPQNVAGYLNAGTADLTDAWVSFTSDQPLFAYGSVVDNGTTDPTFVPMSEDTGTPPSQTTPTTATYTVTLRAGVITISPSMTSKPGDTATFRISALDVTHGFQINDPTGKVVIAGQFYNPGAAPVEKTVTFSKEGTYAYFCTLTTCSPQHGTMNGTFDVGNASPYDPGRGY